MAIITGNTENTEDGHCPELATPSFIITKENVHSLKLSTYNRSHGTTVIVSCLAAPEYRLVGSNVLTCLESSQWDKATPECRPGDPTVGVEFDISMAPMLAAAACVGVLTLTAVFIMVFVLCCFNQNKSPRHAQGARRTPIGLFRSLTLREAESVFSQRRHRYYTASECSDVIDSVSARGASNTLTHSPDLGARQPMSDTVSRSSPTTYITAVSRGTEPPLRTSASDPRCEIHSRPLTDTMSRSSPTTYVTAVSRGAQPSPLQIRVGNGTPYRTWHELFYNNSFS